MTEYILLILLGLTLLFTTACTTVDINRVQAKGDINRPTGFDHSTFNAVLNTYAEDGWVDYEQLKADDALTPYLQQLAVTDPSNLSEPEQLAFWINAYNALTLKLIVDNYPTKSILRNAPVGIRGLPFVLPKINTPFKVKVGEVGGQIRTLDEIEHAIIRPQFDEPRIHFAIVCAAQSCPPLRNEAYTADHLNDQLDDQALIFLNDPTKNEIPAEDGTLRLSKIMKWFQGDFAEDEAGLQRYLARYFEGGLRDQLERAAFEIKYNGYDWTLNDLKRRPTETPA